MNDQAAKARELARRLLEGEATLAMPPPGPDLLGLAWALKDLCYEAWRSMPARAACAAELLQQLRGLALAEELAEELAVQALGPLPQTARAQPQAVRPQTMQSQTLQAQALQVQTMQVQALADWTAGIAAVTRGQLAEAARCLDAAAARFRAAGLPDPAAQTQVPKIMVLSLLGQHGQAIECAESTQRELRSLGNLHAAARVSLNLGGLQLRRNAYAESARHCREAALLFARVGDHEHSIGADIALADALVMLGDVEPALRSYERARVRAGNRGFEAALALVDESVALVDLARGRYRQALAGLESARRRYERLSLPQALAVAEKQLADAYLELRLLPEALALFDTAVAQFAALAQPDEQAWALNQRGRCLVLMGQPGPAGEAFAAAAELFRAQDNTVGQADVALARAELALMGADAAAASRHAAEAAAGFAAVGQADGRLRAELLLARTLLQQGAAAAAAAAFAELLAQARAAQQLQVQLRCLTGQGLAALALAEPAPARAAFDAAVSLFEDQRRALPGDEIRSAFLGEHLRPFEELLRMALTRGQADETLWQLDRFRARALGERLARPPAASAQRERLNWLYRRLQRMQQDADSAPQLGEELRRSERALLEQVRRERLTEGGAAAAGADDGFQVEQLQAALAAADRVVEYGVLDDELFACVVGPGGVGLRRHLASWSATLEAVRALRFQIDSLSRGAARLQPHLQTLSRRCQQRLQQLHALVWAPLAADLAAAERVLVVPHGLLGQVPFAALHDGRQRLGSRHALALAPSARVALRGLRRRPAQAREVLAIGDSGRLEHAAREAGLVASLFAKGRAFVGDAATLDNLQRHAGQADVIHLACHARFRADNPRFSALRLHDGLLSVDLAEALSLGPCTVVLGACESGLAEVGVGDEMVGLVRAFMVAGAARVLASLWPVDDGVTAAFMSSFHRALAQGQPPALALTKAQADVARCHPHPHFWGAFALYGGF